LVVSLSQDWARVLYWYVVALLAKFGS
jgi:hypothetical protein